MVSIIIISYNTQDLTRQCLESIEKYVDLKQHEVIVVDNGSTDGSAEMIEKDFKFVHLIINSSNLGFAIANNQAIKIAKGDLIWLLNSDTQLTQKGMPEKLEEFFGSPKKPAGAKPSGEIADLVSDFGGILKNQTLYYIAKDGFSNIAMIWPWSDGKSTTVKIFRLKFTS